MGDAALKKPAAILKKEVGGQIQGEAHEGGEEEMKVEDPIVTPPGEHSKTPKKSAPKKKSSRKRPPLPCPTSPRSTKRGGRIISTTEHPGGWKLIEIETKSKRKYLKYVHPDGKPFYSEVSAKNAGFVPS